MAGTSGGATWDGLCEHPVSVPARITTKPRRAERSREFMAGFSFPLKEVVKQRPCRGDCRGVDRGCDAGSAPAADREVIEVVCDLPWWLEICPALNTVRRTLVRCSGPWG